MKELQIALDEMRLEKEKLDRQIVAIEQCVNVFYGRRRGPGRPKGTKMSEASRRKLSLAQKRRWASKRP